MERQTTACFTYPGVWSDGYYEPVLFLGAPSESSISESLRTVWSASCFTGPYQCLDKEPWELDLVKSGLETVDHLFGVTKIAPNVYLPYGTYIIREENANGQRVGDLLGLNVPLSAIATIYPVGAYPISDHGAAAMWRARIDARFLQLVRNLIDALKFEAGVLGWEPQLTSDSVSDTKAAATVEQRFDGVALPTVDGLPWCPPSRYDIIKVCHPTGRAFT